MIVRRNAWQTSRAEIMRGIMVAAKKRRKRPEQALQRAVFDHLRSHAYPGVVAFHVPNGGKRTAAEGAIFKGLGVLPGVPDLIAIRGGHVFALELKAGKKGRLSPAQESTIAAMRCAGALVDVAHDLEEAKAFLVRNKLASRGAD